MGFITYNKSFRMTLPKAATVALTDIPLLIYEESGIGKNAMPIICISAAPAGKKHFLW